ncbi:MAG: hypothetical protein KIT58_22820 [Planctomycetota bacterium]|nr:hypothetical protein [Planctomycetota bacterium]
MTADPTLLLAPPPAAAPLTREAVQAYVWARYIEFDTPAFEVDEDAALALLERHYREHPIEADAECFYYGILAYERSFARPHLRRSHLRQALQAFDAYRRQTSEGFSWEPVDDRRAHVVDDLWPALERVVGTALD